MVMMSFTPEMHPSQYSQIGLIHIGMAVCVDGCVFLCVCVLLEQRTDDCFRL